jgi:hypothetical protein
MNAVLYAVFSYATAYIPSPWGVGQFRPAVVIPSFFATIFGPLCGGVGAAIGTLIVDSVKHGQLYAGSLLAAVPGNFVGFYLFGYIVQKFSWRRFIIASEITLTVANAFVAFLYVFFFKVLYLNLPTYGGESLSAQVAFSLGLTLWWFVTMLPFVLLFTPLLIRAASWAFPTVVPKEVREGSLQKELSTKSFSLAMIVPGFIMIVLGLATNLIPLGVYSGSIQLMLYVSGATLAILGSLVYIKKETHQLAKKVS